MGLIGEPSGQIIGTWKLLSWTIEYPDTGDLREAFGPDPQGYINYAPDGRMMVLVLKADRSTPAELVPTPKEKIALYDTMFAYAGRWTFDGKRVTHHIDMSWNNVWEGTEQVRFVTLEGDELHYRLTPARNPFDGRDCVHLVRWGRVG